MIEVKPLIHPLLTLCLACSSSFPPKARAGDIFLTPCCSRPICPSCLSSNPRLARYNPCLSCLGGPEVVSASSSRRNDQSLTSLVKDVNIDGAVRDEDMFVLGDDADDDEDREEEAFCADRGFPVDDPPPSYAPPETRSESVSCISSESPLTTPSELVYPGDKPETDVARNTTATPVYYIKRGDTLQGIALRLGVHGRELCRLNNLPPSTLTTTPHLLHTRTSLKLPPTARLAFNHNEGSLSIPDTEAKSRRVRERAAKRLQTLTKEVDWRVAKAYVALADDPEEEVAYAVKFKEMGGTSAGGRNLQARAVDQYLEDQEWEWEEEQRRAQGRGCEYPPAVVLWKDRNGKTG
ncbi:hypothetical protein BS17DRAFT_705199 [Gyrodon lividus]|nr:hypothetical protein BS17DRAFT_705199 [Gyrodon lividus]